MIKYYFLIFFFFLLGCTSLTIYQPTGINEIPEVSSGGPGNSFDIEGDNGYEYTAINDASRRPPRWDPSVKAANGLADGIAGRIRFPFENKKTELLLGGYAVGVFGIFKYQFVGPHFFQAKKGDFSLAFLTKISSSLTIPKSGSQDGLFGSGGNPWEAKINANGIDGSLIAGYRAKDDLLFYTGGLVSASTITAHIKQKVSDDGKDQGGDYDFGDHVQRSGPVLGVLFQISQRASLHIEGTYLKTNFSQPGLSLDPQTNAAANFRIDLDRP